jgi:hypothetical protein
LSGAILGVGSALSADRAGGRTDAGGSVLDGCNVSRWRRSAYVALSWTSSRRCCRRKAMDAAEPLLRRACAIKKK